ncbi:MAG: HEAT repeat domain-containing protein [Planctomycetaceae bacterium]
MAIGAGPLARVRTRILLLVVSVGMVAVPGLVQAQDDDVGSLLKQGLQLVREGKFKEGVASLRSALDKDPTNEQVLAALGRAEYEAMLSVLASGDDGMKIAQEILRRAFPDLPDRAFNKEDLDRLIGLAVTSEDYGDRFDAAVSLARTYGEFAVPGLLAYLESTNTDHRVNAHIVLMNRIARDAALPLNEALQSPNASVRRLVAGELQTIGDERSLAALAEASEKDTDTDARAKASQALQSLVQRHPYAAGMSASDLYLKLAGLYYADTYRVKSFADKPVVTWRWSDGLTMMPVPRHLYTLKLAEEAAYDALRLNPGSGAARAMLARILMSESLSAAAVAAVSDDETAKEAAAALSTAPWTVAAMGWGTVSQALSDCLDSSDNMVATALLGIMPGIYGSTDFTADNAVVRALSDDANAVRYAAQEAVLRFNGARRIASFPDPEGFLQAVATAAGEVVPRQILVVDGNDARRNKILADLQEQKYLAYGATTAMDGVIRSLRFAGLDMVILASELPDLAVQGAIARLREDERTRNVPIVLVCTDAELADADWRGGLEGKVQGFASVPSGPGLPTEAFRGVVNGAFAGAGPDVQARYRVSAGVLDALAGTDTGNTLFPWNSLTGTLTAVLSSGAPEDPPVKLNALRALGNIGDASAVGALASFFGGGESAGLRASAGSAIGAICRGGNVALDADSFKALLGGTQDADGSVRGAAFAALGGANLTPEQALRVAMANRPGESGGGAGDGAGCGCGDGCGDGCGGGCGDGCSDGCGDE